MSEFEKSIGQYNKIITPATQPYAKRGEINSFHEKDLITTNSVGNGDFEARHILYKKEHLKAFLGLLSCHKSELLFNEQVRKYNQLVRRK